MLSLEIGSLDFMFTFGSVLTDFVFLTSVFAGSMLTTEFDSLVKLL